MNKQSISSTTRSAAASAAAVGFLATIETWSGVNHVSAAAPSPILGYTSRVDSVVITNSSTSYQYNFTLNNTTPVPASYGYGGSSDVGYKIVSWYMPLFDDDTNTIRNIVSPTGWTAEILDPAVTTTFYNNSGSYSFYNWAHWEATNDPTLLADTNAYAPADPSIFENPPYIIHWLADPSALPASYVAESSSLAGFSFESSYAPGNAPYESGWLLLNPTIGDPPSPGLAGASTPASPGYVAAIPEANASMSMLVTLFFISMLFFKKLRERRARMMPAQK